MKELNIKIIPLSKDGDKVELLIHREGLGYMDEAYDRATEKTYKNINNKINNIGDILTILNYYGVNYEFLTDEENEELLKAVIINKSYIQCNAGGYGADMDILKINC